MTRSHRSTLICRRGGFTLVEMLVVIGIILLLISILLPAINRVYIYGVRNRIASDLQAITIALEHYKSEHGDIPRTSYGETPKAVAANTVGGGRISGAQVLYTAMLGLGPLGLDGADGPGFRTMLPGGASGTEPQGKVYGPYLPVDKFKVVGYPPGAAVMANFSNAVLADREGKAILYYPGLQGVDPRIRYVTNATYTGATPVRPMFNSADNSDAMTVVKLQHVLGDLSHDGIINGAEQPEHVGEYILLSGGPDGIYGPASTTVPITSKNPCDDVTNYGR